MTDRNYDAEIDSELDQTNPLLVEELERQTGLQCDIYHTGGGCMVLRVDLSEDGRFLGPQLWLTREEHWSLGFYTDLDDAFTDGFVVQLVGGSAEPSDPDSPVWVASMVVGILRTVIDIQQSEQLAPKEA